MTAYEQQFIQTNGIRLHVVQAGPEDGPLVILLHGFPEFWYGWKTQMDFLAEQGFRVWTPDQRGYNLSDKPKGIAAYNLDLLAADVVGLIDAAGQESVFLAGHDWGATVGWWMGSRYPQRLKKFCAVNAPHPGVFERYMTARIRQMWLARHMFLFQIPRLPEVLISHNNSEGVARSLKNTSRPGTFTSEYLEPYREAWAQPGAWNAMLNWYRAAFQTRPAPVQDTQVPVPTLVIWGLQDSFLEKEGAQQSIDRCDDGRLVIIENAGHWVLHEEPERSSQLILDFFQDEAPS